MQRDWKPLAAIVGMLAALLAAKVVCVNRSPVNSSHAAPVPSSRATQPSTAEPKLERLVSSGHEESGFAVFDGLVRNLV
jgi:hypothetical protein